MSRKITDLFVQAHVTFDDGKTDVISTPRYYQAPGGPQLDVPGLIAGGGINIAVEVLSKAKLSGDTVCAATTGLYYPAARTRVIDALVVNLNTMEDLLRTVFLLPERAKARPVTQSLRRREPCECPCHQDDVMILHCTPCCALNGRKYLNADGSFDRERYDRHIGDVHGQAPAVEPPPEQRPEIREQAAKGYDVVIREEDAKFYDAVIKAANEPVPVPVVPGPVALPSDNAAPPADPPG